MINLCVQLDRELVDGYVAEGPEHFPKVWQEWCEQRSLALPTGPSEMFYDSPGDERGLLEGLDDTARYLENNLEASVAHIREYLPAVSVEIPHNLNVALLPLGRYNFGPRVGLQLFSVRPGADLLETYLFLVHVYYHEISVLNYTEQCRKCSESQESAATFKYWIALLIRNEGVGNFAVLEDLIRLRDSRPDYEFRYFTYARKIRDADLLSRAVGVLNSVFDGLGDHNYAGLRDNVNLLFKNPDFPIINLLGIHMAESVASRFGLDKLLDVHERPPSRFFDLFFRSGSPLAPMFNPEAFQCF